MAATSCAVEEVTRRKLKKWSNGALVLSTGVAKSSVKFAGQKRPFTLVYKETQVKVVSDPLDLVLTTP